MNDIEQLISFIKEGVSPFHVVSAAARRLDNAGFLRLTMREKWDIQPGGKYYVIPFGTVLFAFTIGKNPRGALRLAASHVDFPCLRVKPAPVINRNGYGVLNIEPYGGLILNTWLDRPLSCAGQVVVRGNDPFMPVARLIDWGRPVCTIPNLAIHMNRKVNDGVALNRQVDMLPLAGMFDKEERHFFEEYMSDLLGYLPQDILSWDLTLYPTEEPSLVGLKEDFLSSARLDNLTSVCACLKGIIEGTRASGINGIALFDNEEVGSRTKQGAAAGLLPQVLERIYEACGTGRDDLLRARSDGFFLSMDVAHGLHPNHVEKCDVTNQPVLNGGIVLKVASSQSYVGDAEAVAVVRELCRSIHVPWQFFVNRSDEPGGSTLGAVASAVLPMRAMDIGVPLLAMHSAREMMGVKDQERINALATVFFRA